MRKALRLARKWILLSVMFGAILTFLMAGPLLINYLFVNESKLLDLELTFTAGEMLQYYGAILSGLVTCTAIVTTVHISNRNRKDEIQRKHFERAYAIYHRLPEILARLELAALHVQYSVHMEDEGLLGMLDTMKDSENALREQRASGGLRFSRNIEESLGRITEISVMCQANVERYLQGRKAGGGDMVDRLREMEGAFLSLRESIKETKDEAITEINRFVSVYEHKS